jgi:membrane-associated PAP2 superfamily phosphatase
MRKSDHILVTGLSLILCIAVFEISNIDIYLQDYLYDFGSSQWLLDKNAELPKLIFYDGAKRLIIACSVILLFTLLFFKKSQLVLQHRKGLLVVMLSLILVPSTVGLLKATTNVPCPVDLEHYGGTYPDVSLLDSYPDDFIQKENIRCYPAGHASGGFALLSLVFLFRSRRNRTIAALSAITIGCSMGIYKMLIGDHFLSHTITTMLLSWFIILCADWVVSAFYSETNSPST